MSSREASCLQKWEARPASATAQTGTINFESGGTVNGNYSASSGAVIDFSGGLAQLLLILVQVGIADFE